MKIALVAHHFADSTAGGPGRNASDLARGLLERGHEVHAIAHRFESEDRRILWHPAPLSAFRLFKPYSFAVRVEKVLSTQRFDVVHSFTRIFRCDIHFVGGGVHREYVRLMHEGRPVAGLLARWNPKNWIANLVDRRSFDPASCRIFVVLAERTRREILAHYGIPEEQIRLVRLGVDLDRFSPRRRAESRAGVRSELGLEERDLAALFVGSGWKRKGLGEALKALALAPGWKLLVCGKGPEGRYSALARRLGVEGRVLFLGLRSDVDRLHAAGDALIQPSFQDPFPNACLEALASGLPVVVTRVTGISEIIEEGREGFVIDHAARTEELSARLRDLADPARRDSMGLRARETAEGFSLDRYVEEYLKLYEELARGRP